MRHRDPRAWMLAEAVDMIYSADQLQRQFFQIGHVDNAPCWQPPVDMYVNEHGLGLLIALPGVTPERLVVSLESQAIVVRGERSFGTSLGTGAILRLEIPYGRFERRIGLPDAAYRIADMQFEHGCLRLQLEQQP